MSTVSSVEAWRPGELLLAADRLADAAAAVDEGAVGCRRHLADALDVAGGAWAATAADRAEQEFRTGAALADALVGLAEVLRSGAARLAAARASVLATVDRARAAGFTVSDDGGVLAPEPTPGEWGLRPERMEEIQQLEQQRFDLQSEVAQAFAGAAAADETTAEEIGAVPHPVPLAALAGAHLERARRLDGDHVAALGTAGGFVALARTAREVGSTAADARRLGRYVGLARAGAPESSLATAQASLARTAGAGSLRGLVGRAAMPLTVYQGARDAVTGGGYDGARGWATRGFGAAGAIGATTLLVASAPVAVVAGGAAVVAYGVWSAGNYAVDHWDQIEDAADATGDWFADRAEATAEEVGDAVDWAGEQLSDAADDVADAVSGWWPG